MVRDERKNREEEWRMTNSMRRLEPIQFLNYTATKGRYKGKGESCQACLPRKN